MLTIDALAATDVSAWEIVVATAKMSLLTFIVAAVVTIIVVRRKRLRAAHEEFMHTDVENLLLRRGTTAQPSYEAFMHGAMPNTPWPDWSPPDGHDNSSPTAPRDETP